MKVLVACEFSGIVRDAFRERDIESFSCDIRDCLDSEYSKFHIKEDVREVINDNWDLVIAHPPCTHLSVSGARWFKDKEKEQKEAIEFFMMFTRLKVRYCIENPVSIMSTIFRKPNQIIQPWQFGHGETKKTCLWLNGLPLLQPTKIVEGREARIHLMAPSKDRGEKRSITYEGIAKAMAEQWSIF